MNFSFNHLDTTTIWVGVFAILVFYGYVIRRSKSSHKLKTPPEASGARPIFGHLHLLEGGPKSELPQFSLGALADKYGPIFTIWFGSHRTVVISSSDLAKECYTTHDLALAYRPTQLAAKILGYDHAMFGVAPYGPFWREIRKLSSLELLSKKRLELLKHVRAFEIEGSIKKLYNSTKDGPNGNTVIVEMKQWFGDLVFDIMLTMVAGKRFVDGSAERSRCQIHLRNFLRLLGLFVVRDGIPWLGWLDIGGHEKEMKNTAKELDILADEWLEEHRLKRESGESNGDQHFMDVMHTILDGTSFGGFDAVTINKATSMTLIAAGSDTTVATLLWSLSSLLSNPNVLRKALEELDIHIGKNRLVNESDIENLPYLQAIVKDILRTRPAAPLLPPRQFMEDCILGGYKVPKGSRLILNIVKIHNDPQLWQNPEKFEPERFIYGQKDVDIRSPEFEYIPFGAGRRSCPGARLAVTVVTLVLANILHAFDVSTPNDAPVDMSEIFGSVSLKATPLEVVFTPRLSSCAYM